MKQVMCQSDSIICDIELAERTCTYVDRTPETKIPNMEFSVIVHRNLHEFKQVMCQIDSIICDIE